VKDGSNNSYTMTPNSPNIVNPTQTVTYIFYLIAPANAHKSVTVSFTSGATCIEVWLAEFSGAATSNVLEADYPGGSTLSGSTINTPTLTPSNDGDLLWVQAATAENITSAGGSWTGVLSIQNGDYCEYYIQGSHANVQANFPQNSAVWNSIGAAFKAAPAGIASGLIGYWKLDENPAIHGTTIVDSSGQGNNGSLSTNNGSTNKSVTGQLGQALSFDGTDDSVNAPDLTDGTGYDFSAGASFTLSAWIKPTNLSNGQGIIVKQGGYGPNYAFEIATWCRRYPKLT
jgi:hypothetical protein